VQQKEIRIIRMYFFILLILNVLQVVYGNLIADFSEKIKNPPFRIIAFLNKCTKRRVKKNSN
jgi:cation transporter-like permease